VDLNGAGHPARAGRALRRALRLLAELPRGEAADQLATRVTATLAHSEAELGHLDAADTMLASALEDRGPPTAEIRGILFNQRGLLRLRRGRIAAAVADLDRAVDAHAAHPDKQCAVLLNRSAAHLYGGRVRPAGADLERCAALAAAHDHAVLEAKARHNLGYLALLRRDIPAALRDLGAAHDALVEVAPGYCGTILVDRARALRDAGMLDEADAELRAAAGVLAHHRLDQDLGEAQLVAAEVALSAGRAGDARRHAGAARRRFARRGNRTWALLAELVEVQAGGAGAVRELAAQLAEAGMAAEARSAGLVADRTELREGRLRRLPVARPDDRIGVRLQVRLVRAEAAQARGDESAARREVRRALVDLHRHRTGLGSHDLQAGAAGHGRALVEVALDAALRDGRPSVVHAWAERTRAVTLRTVPVRPPPDPVLAAALAEVRAAHAAEHAARLAGMPADADLAARRAGFERVVRQRSWQVHGAGGADRTVGLGRLREELAPARGVLVSYLRVRSTLSALVVTGRAARVVPLGEVADVEAAVARLRADLDVLARGRLPAAIGEVVRRSAAAGAARLDAALWRPLAALTGTGPVVLVPTGALSAVPWAALPGLRGRPVAVASSATAWCGAERPPGAPSGAVLVAGPGLRRAEQEVREAGARWPSAAVLVGPDATGAKALVESAGRGVLHLAAHGRHEPQNPLFSCVELADGPLFGYDLPGAPVPAHVVLSACDVGLAVVRAGDEPLGMTAAFLRAGAASVVSSVAKVDDDLARAVMTRYHGGLGAGRSPAEALAAAAERCGGPVPFVAYGAAW
jgi:tetratricopeptide (TPR) repeat protein